LAGVDAAWALVGAGGEAGGEGGGALAGEEGGGGEDGGEGGGVGGGVAAWEPHQRLQAMSKCGRGQRPNPPAFLLRFLLPSDPGPGTAMRLYKGATSPT
jgi:hypothetical protein